MEQFFSRLAMPIWGIVREICTAINSRRAETTWCAKIQWAAGNTKLALRLGLVFHVSAAKCRVSPKHPVYFVICTILLLYICIVTMYIQVSNISTKSQSRKDIANCINITGSKYTFNYISSAYICRPFPWLMVTPTLAPPAELLHSIYVG